MHYNEVVFSAFVPFLILLLASIFWSLRYWIRRDARVFRS